MSELDPNLLSKRYGSALPLPNELLGRGNSTLETILSHRSVRKYVDRPLEEGVLELLVAAAQSASTSSNLHCYSIIAISDQERKKVLSATCGNQQQIIDAPLFLLFCADLARLKIVCERECGPIEGLTYAEMFIMAVIDAALSAQNFVIAAESLGLGTCYIGGARNHPERIAEYLELPDRVFVTFGLTVGYPEPNAGDVKPRLPQKNCILHHEKYEYDVDHALNVYEETMKSFNAGQHGREGRGWLAPTARRVGTPEALGAERAQIKAFLTKAGLDIH